MTVIVFWLKNRVTVNSLPVRILIHRKNTDKNTGKNTDTFSM